jgi:hypothetical protein
MRMWVPTKRSPTRRPAREHRDITEMTRPDARTVTLSLDVPGAPLMRSVDQSGSRGTTDHPRVP